MMRESIKACAKQGVCKVRLKWARRKLECSRQHATPLYSACFGNWYDLSWARYRIIRRTRD